MKIFVLIFFIMITKVLNCLGNEYNYLNDIPFLDSDSTQFESKIRFEIKNLSTSYIVLHYSFNYIIGYTDTLVVINGICEKKYYFTKPVYMEVRGDGFYGKIFLSPHYQLTVKIDRNNKINGIISFQYDGNGKIANDYLDAIKTVGIPPKFGDIGKTITEEQYLEKVDKHYTILDSIYSIHLRKSSQLLEKDEYLKSFFDTEKTDLRYNKGGRLLNFINARKYKKNKATTFFEQYIEPLDLQKEEINLTSTSSILFFNSYLIDYLIARQNESNDSTIIRKIGHYAYKLDYAVKHYQEQTRAYVIAENLHFLAGQLKATPKYLPPVDSLIKVYDSYLTKESREIIWKRLETEMASKANIYAEKEFIDNFKMVTAHDFQLYLKDRLTPITVIDLWASWCGNCIEAFPSLDQLQAHYELEKKVSFLRISVDDNENNWKKSVEKWHLKLDETYWIAGGMKSDFAKKFNVDFLPRYIIINQDGKILKLYAPHINDTQKFISLINTYLKQL